MLEYLQSTRSMLECSSYLYDQLFHERCSLGALTLWRFCTLAPTASRLVAPCAVMLYWKVRGIVIRPVLIIKGNTKLAMYGLGNRVASRTIPTRGPTDASYTPATACIRGLACSCTCAAEVEG